MNEPTFRAGAPFKTEGQTTPRNPMAGASLMLGLASLLTLAVSVFLMMPLFWITSIPAILLGHLALRKIGGSVKDISGGAMARGGLRFGYAVAVVLPVGALYAVPLASKVADKSDQAGALRNCRKIITCLRLYSSDSSGGYPDAVMTAHPRTSNDAFRELFKAGVVDDEMIFSCSVSPFKPDGKIGTGPDYKEALKKGENHWAMTKGLNDSASGDYPLVYENPASTTGLPGWNADLAGVAKAGRCWLDGSVIVGMNDASVSLRPLDKDHGKSVGLAPSSKGTEVFTGFNDPKGPITILNVDQ